MKRTPLPRFRASRWYAKPADFQQLCADALWNARAQSTRNFVMSLAQRAQKYGLNVYVTDKQMTALCALANCPVPQRLDFAVGSAPTTDRAA